MKFHFQIILFLVIFSFSYSQKNKEFEKLKKYTRYEVVINPKSKYIWTYKYKLKNGYLTEQENYARKELVYKCNYLYDTLNNIQHTIELFKGNKGYINDSIIKKEIDLVTNEINDIYTNRKIIKKEGIYNSGGNLIIYDDSIFAKYEYKYDSLNNIIEEKIYEYPEKTKTETITYKYDKFNNVIEVNRVFNYTVEFPIMVVGGIAHYKKENYRYIYNKDGLWIKKYWIVEGKETLIEKRKFFKN